MRTVGERVRQLRKDHGVGQEELARRIKVTGQTISRLERGETKEPDMATLRGIAEVFGVTVDQLLTGEDFDKPSETFGQARVSEDVARYELDEMSEADGVRSQAVINLVKDPALEVTRNEIDVLQNLVQHVAAYRGGLPDIEKILRVLFLAYRSDPGGFDLRRVPTELRLKSRTAGDAETQAARERNEAKGHMPLKKPKAAG